MSSEIAIKVENLCKSYPIYNQPRDRLKQFVLPRLQRMVGMSPKQYYREFWALKDVSFEVKKGETVGIVGRNGSGKSTLLQIICGTLSPTSGNIITNGRIAALLELGSGFNPEFTGRENVYMSASILGLTKEEIDARFGEIVAFADIGEFIEQPVKTYSSGMYVRLAFAVAANVDADILVIDEALSVGDFLFQQKCMRFLRKFMKTGTVLFVSHDMGAVINLCSSAIWLDQGKTISAGPSKAICESYLETCYAAQQGAGIARRSIEKRQNSSEVSTPAHDHRMAYMKARPLQNDIEVFAFDPDAPSFGKGGATIESVQLCDVAGNALTWIVGGETVVLVVRAVIHDVLSRPIIGFFIKDRLGQAIFGDNTYLTYLHNPVSTSSGDRLEARFTFAMPLLPAGKYSVCAAIADGTQEDHVQHHWIHDALIFESRVSPLHPGGLVGIPMSDIHLARYPSCSEALTAAVARCDELTNGDG